MNRLICSQLTRGKYAFLGYAWNGCYGDGVNNKKLADGYLTSPLWDEDFGEPTGPCVEPNPPKHGDLTPGFFKRTWSKATFTWNCSKPPGSMGAVERLP